MNLRNDFEIAFDSFWAANSFTFQCEHNSISYKHECSLANNNSNKHWLARNRHNCLRSRLGDIEN